MLDINICIYIRQRRPEEVLRRFRKLRPGEAVLFGHHLRHLEVGLDLVRMRPTKEGRSARHHDCWHRPRSPCRAGNSEHGTLRG
jgi:hypothetical protein